MILMAEVFDCSSNSQLLSGSRAARQAIGRGELVVIPTDTVYGLAADAFTPGAVQRLLDAKGRTRQSPPPVLIPDTATLGALAAEVVAPVRVIADTFWPGALTLVLVAQPSLQWDLGDTGGTVALRIPDSHLTLELLRETGPLAVSSANSTGDPAARTAAEAKLMLGDTVSVYLEAGEVASGGVASTIVDGTGLTEEGGVLRILRDGGVSREALEAALPEVTVLGVGEELPEPESEPELQPVSEPQAESGSVPDPEPASGGVAEPGARSTARPVPEESE